MKKEKELSPEHWKRKVAMAIGRPDLIDAPDEKLEAAHDAHMLKVHGLVAVIDDVNPGSVIKGGMPPGPASIANERPLGFTNDGITITKEKQRGVVLESLMNEAVHRQGITRDVARRQLQTLRPELFPKPVQKGPTPEQVRARDERSDEVLSLVNEKMKGGTLEYEDAFNLVRIENPQLFPKQKPSTK